jgi:hypothetical protein
VWALSSSLPWWDDLVLLFVLFLKTRLVPEKNIAFDIFFLWQELLAISFVILTAVRIIPASEIEETERMDGCCDGNNGEKRLTDQYNNNNNNSQHKYNRPHQLTSISLQHPAVV